MKQILKTATLESKFPIMAVENGAIISKYGDITVAFRVELLELFTVTSGEYSALHATWVKALKVLPNYTIVHKQDWFIKENYKFQIDDKYLCNPSIIFSGVSKSFGVVPIICGIYFSFLSSEIIFAFELPFPEW